MRASPENEYVAGHHGDLTCAHYIRGKGGTSGLNGHRERVTKYIYQRYAHHNSLHYSHIGSKYSPRQHTYDLSPHRIKGVSFSIQTLLWKVSTTNYSRPCKSTKLSFGTTAKKPNQKKKGRRRERKCSPISNPSMSTSIDSLLWTKKHPSVYPC